MSPGTLFTVLTLEVEGLRHDRPLVIRLTDNGELLARVQWRSGPRSHQPGDWLVADAWLWDLLSPAQCKRLLMRAKAAGHE